MPRFQYRLALLLDRKEEARKEADAEAARRDRQLEEERARLAALERRERDLTQERERLRRELLAAPSNGEPLTAADALTRAEYIRAMAADIEAARNDVFSQRIAVEEQERRVEQGRELAQAAKREVEVLTKHRSRQEQRYMRDLAAREELELDETGNVLYTTRRSQA
jgi:hypothetical protein